MSIFEASPARVAARKQSNMDHDTSIALMKWLSAQTKRMGIAQDVYVVGGAVRNFVLDQPIKDIDMVVDSLSLGRNRDAEWLAQQLARRIPAQTDIITSSLLVSTIKIKGSWVLDGYEMEGNDIDIADARAEEYEVDQATGEYIGHKPLNVSPTTMEDDVSRREFTFNTLLWRLMDLAQGPDKAEIIDLTGCGVQDLNDRVMRCPGDPDEIFAKDPTRIIRTIKFAFKYGMKLPPDVKAAAKRQAKGLKRIPSKAWTVLQTIVFDNPQYKKALDVMEDLGVTDVLAEMMQANKQFNATLGKYSHKRGLAYMFDLMDVGIPVDAPMKFLDVAQRKRLRQITTGMERDEALDYLDMLKNPGKGYDKKFIPTLAVSLGYSGSQMREFMPGVTVIGREALLADPSLVNNPAALMRQVEQRVRRETPTRVATRWASENEPTSPDLWAKVQALAKGEQKSMSHGGKTIEAPNDGKGFTVFPSAYANGWASKTYKDLGGGWKKKAEAIPGGKARGKKPSDFDAGELGAGIKVEHEHLIGGGYTEAEARAKAQEIAMDHLAEIPDYYTRLDKMESEAGVKHARGKAKKDVGHGGLDEWFSGHSGAKGEGEDATWGDWVSISPVTKTLDSGKKVEKGDIVGECGISDDADWKEITKGGEDPLKCMPRQKAHDMPKAERAEKAKAKQKAEQADSSRGKKPTMTPTFQKEKGKKKASSIDRVFRTPKPFTGFRPGSGQGVGFKPKGLWYSCGSEWDDWCRYEMPHWITGSPYVYRIEVNLSRMLVIRNDTDFWAFESSYLVRGRGMDQIDWKAVARDYDGIEICPYQQQQRSSDWYYGWDVASGCIWGSGAFKSVEPVETCGVEKPGRGWGERSATVQRIQMKREAAATLRTSWRGTHG